MLQRVRHQLHFGPYRTPSFRYGKRVQDEVRGEVEFVGTSSGRIPWPVGKQGRYRSLVVYKDLAKAIRREAVLAVAYWWGVTPQTVTKWRRRLGITNQWPKGTQRLRRAYTEEPFFKRATRLARAMASDPAAPRSRLPDVASHARRTCSRRFARLIWECDTPMRLGIR
jgi:hypothetical protein